MSAFVRRAPGARGGGGVTAAAAQDAGTRPGLHGQVLLSSGVAGLDRLLGGGLPLGSLLLLLEDAHSQQHASLLRCFIGEGVACRHSVAWLSAQQLSPEAVAALVPDQAARGSEQQAPTPAAPHAAGPAAAAPSQDGLRIAWQYRKYIQAQQLPGGPAAAAPRQPDGGGGDSSSRAAGGRGGAAAAVAAGVGREWCHRFDLTRGLSLQQLQASRLQARCCRPSAGGASAVDDAAAAARAFLAGFQPSGPVPVPSRNPASVGRLVIESLGSPQWWPECAAAAASAAGASDSMAALEAAMLAAVADLRLALQDASAAAVVTCPAALFSDSFQAQLQHLADAVIALQSLADDSDLVRLLPDPSSAAALLEVRRLPNEGLLRQRHPDERLFVLRNKRRAISVGVLDLVPLEAAAGDERHGAQPCGGAPSF